MEGEGGGGGEDFPLARNVFTPVACAGIFFAGETIRSLISQ